MGKRIFSIAPSLTYQHFYRNSSINTNFFPSETSETSFRASYKYYMVVGFVRLNLLENLLTTYVGTGLGCFRVAGFALFLQDEDTIG